MARPRLDPAVPRPHPRPVRLDADVDDALCRLSLRYDVTIHALLRMAARQFVKMDDRKIDKIIVLGRFDA